MPYMIYQQYTTAIKEAYTNHPDLVQQLESARAARAWLESLAIDPRLRDALVEQISTVEIAFEDLLRMQSR